MKFKYILFDWDGTLAKTLDIWIAAYKQISKEIGIDIGGVSDPQIVKTFFGKEAHGFEEFGIQETEVLYDRIKKYVDDNVSNVEIYPNVKNALDELNNLGCRLALHTSSNKNILYPAIVNNELEKFFDLILTRDDVENPKPDPEIIYKELSFFNANKSDILIVGDSNSDVEAAKNAGVACALYYPKDNEKFYTLNTVNSYNADFIIGDLLDLIKIVN